MTTLPPPISAITLLMETSRLFRGEFRRRAAHLQLTQPQVLALSCLARQPGLTQSVLADKLEVHPVTVTQLIDRLQKAGWVRRETHENDRRAVRLYLTDEADPILAEVWQVAESARRDALRGLSEADQKTFERLLALVKSNLTSGDAAADVSEGPRQ